MPGRAHARARLAGPAALALACAALARADDGAVTVSATRVARPSLEVPASVDRLAGEDLRFARPGVNLSEAAARIPGLVVQNRQNYAQDLQISSRGFGTRAGFGVRGMRLVADGIPASMPDGQGQAATFDLGSAERVEVMRGPFSVLHGNAAGGVIDVLTESGRREPGIEAERVAGSFGTSRSSVKAAGASGAVEGLVSVSRFKTDGWRDHSSATREQLNARLGWALSGTTRIALVASALSAPDTQDPLGLTRAQADAAPRQAAAVANTFNTRKTVGQQQAGVTLEHRFGEHLASVAAYGGHRDVRQYLALVGATPATSSGGVVDLDRDYGGASARLSSTLSLAGRPFTLSLGGEVERMAERRKGFVNNSGAIGALRRDEDNIVTSTGLYAQGEWRPGERWIALAGLRATRVAFDSRDYYIAAGNPDDSGRRTFSQATPAAGLAYRIAPTTSVYANYGRGFETPTFAELAYRPSGSGLNFSLAPSRSRHLEAGVKAVFGASGRVNAAVFDVRTENEIVVDTNTGGRSTFRNAGRTARRGAELLAEAALPAGLEVTAAWTLLDARFRDAFTGGTPAVTVSAGNALPGVPRTQGHGELKWRHAPLGLTAALDVTRKSRVAVDDRNTEFAPAWTSAGAAIELVQRGSGWQLSEYLRIDNLGDRRIIGSVIVNESNGRFYEPSPGRNATLGVRAKLLF